MFVHPVISAALIELRDQMEGSPPWHNINECVTNLYGMSHCSGETITKGERQPFTEFIN